MAKFAVALCILLVACGAQGDGIFDSASIESLAEWFAEKIQEKKQELADGIAGAVKDATDFEAKIDEKTEQILDEWKQELEEYSDNAENLSWCVTRKSKFEKAVKTVKSDGLKCVADRRDHLSNSYDLTVAAFDEFKNDVNNAKDQAGECGWFDWSCWGDIWNLMTGELNDDWNVLVSDATSLAGEFISFANTLESCGFNDAFENLTEEKEKSSLEVQKCLVNLECTTE